MDLVRTAMVESILRTAAARPDLDGEAVAALAAALARGLAQVQETWPDAPSPEHGFAEYVAARITGAGELCIADLFLAWWAQQSEAGVAALELAYASQIDRVFARFSDLSRAELVQALRIKLFVSSHGTPKLAEYTGRGPLGGWLRVVASRTCLDLVRARNRLATEDGDDALLALATVPLDVVRALDRERMHGAVRTAFREAIASLGDRPRTFLRLATNQGLTLEHIAAMYRVGRATVARDLAKARAHLREQTRAYLAARFELTAAEIDSVICALDSELGSSLARVLDVEQR
ncbi:MAG: sigma-70 family RNA polymerase sigma factor [Kofleriaceae bacterium]